MFPLSDSIPARRFPFITLFIIFLTVYIFIQQLMSPDETAFVLRNALTPANIDPSHFSTLIPFISAIFLHAGFLHIISNMWFLWIFGDNVEGFLPPFVFLILYLLAGVVGNIIQFLIMPASQIPMLGASGAVAGVLGCYYILFPYSKIKTLVFIFFFVTIVEISAPLMLGYWFVLQLISGAASLPFANDQGGVAFWAHAAGFLIGVIFGLVFKSISRPYEIIEPD